jgi:hypothetical protein
MPAASDTLFAVFRLVALVTCGNIFYVAGVVSTIRR